MTLDSFSMLAVSQNKDVLKMGVSPFERNKKNCFEPRPKRPKAEQYWDDRNARAA